MLKVIEGILQHKKNLIAVVVGQGATAIGVLFGVRLLTEFISPTVFGEYKLLLAALSLLTGIFLRPFIQFAMRAYHDAELNGMASFFLGRARKLFKTYAALIAVLFVALASQFLNKFIAVSPVLLLILLTVIILQSFVEFERAVLVTQNKQIHAGAVNLILRWITPVVIVVATLLTSQTVAAIFTGTILVLVGVFLMQLYFSRDFGHGEKEDFEIGGLASVGHDALRFGLPLVAVGLFSWLVHESDRFFLAYYHSEATVGIYSAAYGLVSAPFLLVVGTMTQFLSPIMFRMSAAKQKQNRIDVVTAMLIASTTICSFGVVIIAIFSEQITWLALGEVYRRESIDLLPWISCGYGVLAVSSSFDLAAFGSKRTKDILISYGIAGLANLSLNFILIPEFGGMGAAVATLISLSLYLIAMATLFCYRELNHMKRKSTA